MGSCELKQLYLLMYGQIKTKTLEFGMVEL